MRDVFDDLYAATPPPKIRYDFDEGEGASDGASGSSRVFVPAKMKNAPSNKTMLTAAANPIACQNCNRCAVMIAADAQKYFTLRVKRGLIIDGVHRYVRHPNYLGEIVQWTGWAIMTWSLAGLAFALFPRQREFKGLPGAYRKIRPPTGSATLSPT